MDSNAIVFAMKPTTGCLGSMFAVQGSELSMLAFAASTVFDISIATVIGPTPPGTVTTWTLLEHQGLHHLLIAIPFL